jgi:hypothetical protein
VSRVNAPPGRRGLHYRQASSESLPASCWLVPFQLSENNPLILLAPVSLADQLIMRGKTSWNGTRVAHPVRPLIT